MRVSTEGIIEFKNFGEAKGALFVRYSKPFVPFLRSLANRYGALKSVEARFEDGTVFSSRGPFNLGARVYSPGSFKNTIFEQEFMAGESDLLRLFKERSGSKVTIVTTFASAR